jgi:hypothetical protein
MAPRQSNAPRKCTRQIDGIVEPILGVLNVANLGRERAKPLAGVAIAKELKPLFAIVTGFVLGRTVREHPLSLFCRLDKVGAISTLKQRALARAWQRFKFR